jgi:hypothetical protein
MVSIPPGSRRQSTYRKFAEIILTAPIDTAAPRAHCYSRWRRPMTRSRSIGTRSVPSAVEVETSSEAGIARTLGTATYCFWLFKRRHVIRLTSAAS